MSAQQEQVLEYSWLHDDTEEDLVGADWHQDAIRGVGLALKTLARERQWPWHVGDQLTLIGDVPGRERWSPAPDISVHPTLGPTQRRDLDVRVEGPPTLALEVASRSTWAYDVSLERQWRGRRQAGKAYGYLALLGIAEYLVFDPRQEFLPGQVRAWRRVGPEVREWLPDAEGRYHSAALAIAFVPDGQLLRVLDPQGAPVPYWFEDAEEARRTRELEREMAFQAREMAFQARELALQAGELTLREREIAALRAELDLLRGRPAQG